MNAFLNLSSEKVAILFNVATFLVASVVAVWMFRDTESRGKNGLAAGLIAFLSAFYGLPLTLMVMCIWILCRPEYSRRFTGDSDSRLPKKLQADIVEGPAPQDFLEDLEEDN